MRKELTVGKIKIDKSKIMTTKEFKRDIKTYNKWKKNATPEEIESANSYQGNRI